MIKHVILWKIKDEFDDAKKTEIKQNAKRELEALVGQVPGLVKMHIQIDSLETSTADLMLDSTLESADALKGYAGHPAHVHVADNFVRPFMEVRLCLDYEV